MVTDSSALVQRGFALLQQGQFAAAGQLAQQALAAAPELVPALNLLAIALHLQARNAESAQAFAELTRRDPATASHWSNLGTTLRALRRNDESLAAYRQAARLGESTADFHYNVGLLHVDRGDFEAAHVELARAHAMRPDDVEIAYQLAATCLETLDNFEGIAALANWPRMPGLTTELVARIGNVLMSLGDLEGGQRALAQAQQDPAPDAAALVQLALALERANRLDAADARLAQLERHPGRDAVGADFKLARARLAQRAGRHEEAARLFDELAKECQEPERRHFHLFPLAKSLDALHRHADTMATLSEAHASQVAWIRATQPEVAERRRETMRVTRFGCEAQDVARWRDAGAPAAEESPVFIVAFPRSGTTLLEHTLDAHPRLRTMDEQPFLQNAIGRLVGPGVRYPDALAELVPAQLDAARDFYWSLVRQRVSLAPGEQLIDKNPLNILRLPAIARLFPNARILLAIRHPCDVLLSCFMQHFRAEFAWQCRDLETMGLAYRRTFDFWYQQAAILRPSVREVRYESLVAEFEPQVRALADFLALPWTDALLEPGANARRHGFISAPSYAQVVEPVHSRSVGRARAYGRWLAVMRPDLEPYLERWGYAWPESEQEVG